MALSVLAGQIILADDINKILPITARKTATTSRTSTATLANDPHLVLALRANTEYQVTGCLLITGGNNAGDFKYAWTFPSGADVAMGGSGPWNGITTGASGDGEWLMLGIDSTSPTDRIPYAASVLGVNGAPLAYVRVGSTAGNLTLQWSQETSNATATNLLAGSWITATPVVSTA